MTTTARAGAVALGYVIAFVAASALVAARIAATAQAAQSAGGMYAVGDMILFLAVFGVLAAAPTAAALWMLRGNRLVWTTLGAVAAAGAVISLAAIGLFVAGRSAPAGSTLYVWTAWTPLWLLGAPPAALACLGAGIIAPRRIPRAILVVAALVHAAVGTGIFMFWFASTRG
jgi:hypothetical protein